MEEIQDQECIITPVTDKPKKDKSKRTCQRCEKTHPATSAFYNPVGRGYFSKHCHKCDFEIKVEGGIDPSSILNPVLGIDIKQQNKDWRESQKEQKTKQKIVKEKKDFSLAPWNKSSSPATPSATSSPTASSSSGGTYFLGAAPVNPTTDQNQITTEFDLNPVIQDKTEDSTTILVNDYMNIQPEAPDPKCIKQTIHPIKPKKDPEDPDASDDEDEEEGYEAEPLVQEDPDIRATLFKLIDSYPALSKRLRLSFETVHSMDDEACYKAVQLFQSLKNNSSLRQAGTQVVVAVAGLVEERSKVLEPKGIDLTGYRKAVEDDEEVPCLVSEIISENQELFDCIGPEYRLCLNLATTALSTNLVNNAKKPKSSSMQEPLCSIL